MAYDEELARRVRALLAGDAVSELKMFGGLAFLINGNMAVAAGSGGKLMVRCDSDDAQAFIEQGAEPMVMRGRELNGWLEVDGLGQADDETLSTWVERGVGYAATLPPKPVKA